MTVFPVLVAKTATTALFLLTVWISGQKDDLTQYANTTSLVKTTQQHLHSCHHHFLQRHFRECPDQQHLTLVWQQHFFRP